MWNDRYYFEYLLSQFEAKTPKDNNPKYYCPQCGEMLQLKQGKSRLYKHVYKSYCPKNNTHYHTSWHTTIGGCIDEMTFDFEK